MLQKDLLLELAMCPQEERLKNLNVPNGLKQGSEEG